MQHFFILTHFTRDHNLLTLQSKFVTEF